MKKFTLVSLICVSLVPLSQVTQAAEQQAPIEPWRSSTLRTELSERPAGNRARGAELHEQHMCSSCHGKSGVGPTRNWPSVAGQTEEYTYKMLLDYHSGARNEDAQAQLMVSLAQLLDKQAMSDLAAYYASLANEQSHAEQAPALVTDGDPDRLITPCASCHGLDGQGGIKGTPALRGQNPRTLQRALEHYRSGERSSDLYAVMRQAAEQLTADEIRQLSVYYGSVTSQ